MDLSPAPRPAIAVLVDGENLSKDLAPEVLKAARALGDPQVRRVYGNLNAVAGWEEHGFRLCPTRPGKNAADMLLCVEALVLALRDGQATLMIASSDRDFSYLAEQLRELGKQVVGIGKETAPISFRAACTQFLQLPLAKAQSTNPSARVPATKAIPVIRGILAQSNRPGNWGTMSWIGHCLRQSKPPFEPADYGHISIEAFVRSLNFFEFGQSATGETQVRDPKPNVLGDAPHAP